MLGLVSSSDSAIRDDAIKEQRIDASGRQRVASKLIKA